MIKDSTLFDAIKAGDREAVQQILSENPRLADGKSPEGISWILLACYYRQAEIARTIADHASGIELYSAAALGRNEIVEQSVGADPGLLNSYSADGFPLLGLAVYFGHNELAKELIARGADVNAQALNQAKVAPLHAAVSTRNLELAKVLLSNGASVNLKQTSGVTPLHGAAHNGDIAMVELLLEYGADCDARTDDGKTPLDMAVELNFARIVEKLCTQEKQTA